MNSYSMTFLLQMVQCSDLTPPSLLLFFFFKSLYFLQDNDIICVIIPTF